MGRVSVRGVLGLGLVVGAGLLLVAVVLVVVAGEGVVLAVALPPGAVVAADAAALRLPLPRRPGAEEGTEPLVPVPTPTVAAAHVAGILSTRPLYQDQSGLNGSSHPTPNNGTSDELLAFWPFVASALQISTGPSTVSSDRDRGGGRDRPWRSRKVPALSPVAGSASSALCLDEPTYLVFAVLDVGAEGLLRVSLGVGVDADGAGEGAASGSFVDAEPVLPASLLLVDKVTRALPNHDLRRLHLLRLLSTPGACRRRRGIFILDNYPPIIIIPRSRRGLDSSRRGERKTPFSQGCLLLCPQNQQYDRNRTSI